MSKRIWIFNIVVLAASMVLGAGISYFSSLGDAHWASFVGGAVLAMIISLIGRAVADVNGAYWRRRSGRDFFK